MTVAIVGAGWLGAELARACGSIAIARRAFMPRHLDGASVVVVASGRAMIRGNEPFARVLHDELRHLRSVLDAAIDAGARHVVVLGSSDVAGLAPVVEGTTPQAPRTPYALIKAALEDECVLRRRQGQPVTATRLAPVHGRGKARTTQLVQLSRLPVIPLPGGGRHSTGFVLLTDAVAAVRRLANQEVEDVPAVVAVGAGAVPLASLLRALATAQGRRTRVVHLPQPPGLDRFIPDRRLPDKLEWLLRLALPRAVLMEADVPVTALSDTAEELVQC